MAVIAINVNKINKFIVPNLTNIADDLQVAYNTSLDLKNILPSSSNIKSSISEISSSIYDAAKETKNVVLKISNKAEKVKQIEQKSESKISQIASKMGNMGLVGTISGAVIGSTRGLVGAAIGGIVGGAVGSKVGETIEKTGASIAEKFVSGVKNLGSKIWNGIKSIGAKVVSGVESVAKKVSETAKSIGSAISSAFDWTRKAVKNVGSHIGNAVSTIWSGIKSIGKKIFDTGSKIVNKVASWIENKAFPWIKNAASTVWSCIKTVGKHIGKTLATIVNAAVSLVEGVVSFVEAIVDAAALLVGAVASVGGALVDLCQGIFKGEWDWSATKSIWTKAILPFVGTDWTSKAFEWQGKWIINDWAYKPFKRGETGAKIVKGVGYVVGVVVASVFTAGAAGAAAGTSAGLSSGATAVTSLLTSGTSTVTGTLGLAVASGVISGSAKAAKSMQDGYKKLSDEEKESGSALRKLAASSVLSGLVEGTTWALTMGNGLTKSKFRVISKVGNIFKNNGTTAKAIMQATKAYATEGISVITDGDFDFTSATIDAGISAATSVLFDTKLKGFIKNKTESWNNDYSNYLDQKYARVADEAVLEGLDGATPNFATNVAKKALNALDLFVHGKDTGKIWGKIVKDPIKTGAEEIVDGVSSLVEKIA